MGIPAGGLHWTNEKIYRRLKLGERKFSESEILDLLTQCPDLIQRPNVEKGKRGSSRGLL
jgi:arsenate reductase-like glutaredoxin family protein